MDRKSRSILRFIGNSMDKIPHSKICDKFGITASKHIYSLEKDGFIKSGKTVRGVNPNLEPIYSSDGLYEITPTGIDFLEHRFGIAFDKWLTRIIAIWGAITGTIALVLELMQRFL